MIRRPIKEKRVALMVRRGWLNESQSASHQGTGRRLCSPPCWVRRGWLEESQSASPALRRHRLVSQVVPAPQKKKERAVKRPANERQVALMVRRGWLEESQSASHQGAGRRLCSPPHRVRRGWLEESQSASPARRKRRLAPLAAPALHKKALKKESKENWKRSKKKRQNCGVRPI